MNDSKTHRRRAGQQPGDRYEQPATQHNAIWPSHCCNYYTKTSTSIHFTHCTTRTARRGRPFRHRCVKLRSPSLQHFNARLPRSFLKQPYHGPYRGGVRLITPKTCYTQTRTLKNPQETLVADRPVSRWISPSALASTFTSPRLLGTEKPLGDFQPAKLLFAAVVDPATP